MTVFPNSRLLGGALCVYLTVFSWTYAGALNPYDRQVAEKVNSLGHADSGVRMRAAEALGYLRAYDAAEPLAGALGDRAAEVRCAAAISLGWCGGRGQVEDLLEALDDRDWTVRQAAWVALTNLTGLEWPYDALAGQDERAAQAARWRDWWLDVPGNQVPSEVFKLVEGAQTEELALGCEVTASTTYKGPPGVLADGAAGGSYWQTKQAPFPQHCTVDLGAPKQAGCVVVHQYGPGFCMTDYELSASVDGESYEILVRESATPKPRLVFNFEPREVRYLRITSFASENPTYPTTFFEVAVYPDGPPSFQDDWCFERGLRALGALGGEGADALAVELVARCQQRSLGTPAGRMMMQTGIRALGRLGGPTALALLGSLLEDPEWCRYAADALGDMGSDEAAAMLLAVYPRYARSVSYGNPKVYPEDDWPNLSPVDRAFETPHAIAAALARMPLEEEKVLAKLRRAAPLFLTNLPGDFDAALLYEPEAGHEVASWLLARAGYMEVARDAVFHAFGLDYPPPPQPLAKMVTHYIADVPHVAAWLPVLCATDESVPLLTELLEHENGWIRINAAKSLMFLGAREAAPRIAALLDASKPEAEYGYYGVYRFGKGHIDGGDQDAQDEYDDPSPRWREAYVRALGRLGDDEYVPLLAGLLEDGRNVVDIQHATAFALDELGTPDALDALREAEAEHPYYSVRVVAREALWRRGMDAERGPLAHPTGPVTAEARPANRDSSVVAQPPPAVAGGHQGVDKSQPGAAVPQATIDRSLDSILDGIVFIRGDNAMPNDFQIDPWRQTYSTTDSGPTYRLGKNLCVLRGGTVKALTGFTDGYVADCEVSWDGQRVVFAHRGGDRDPWWHLYEINANGSGLRQLTDGPYHDVQPAYLPDGRIVFSSSRIGMRDEYHGYLSTGLTVMNPDGTGIRCIAFNVGRDNEPAILPDGRIVFSRLELFYSRLKTELTLHAVYPDGTRDVTLYGPERRDYWRRVTINSGEKWWGEVPGRHRVLRMTQPQPVSRDTVVCATTAGLTIVGPGRLRETVVPHDKNMAVTTPFPLGDGTALCAATMKHKKRDGSVAEERIDLGLYRIDLETGGLVLLHNDPATAEFEPRPLAPRKRPPVLAEQRASHGNAYTAKLFCRSARNSQDARVRERGKLVRVVEGQPVLGRHRTHRALGENAWRNHTGTNARILGTAPLAADGSFSLVVPADRLLHVQVLDSDRQVMGNQLVWMYARPGETRSCAGCHERPDSAPPWDASRGGYAAAGRAPPVACLPTAAGGEFSYRAKFWNKGELPDEGEARTRTVRAVNLMGRY